MDKIKIDRLLGNPADATAYLNAIRKNPKNLAMKIDGVEGIDKIAIEILFKPDYSPNPLAVALSLDKGFSGSTVRLISSVVPKDLLATVLGVSATNLSNQYRRKEVDRFRSESLLEFLSVWSSLLTTFNHNTVNAKGWLMQNVPALCNKKPIELIDTSSGRQALIETLKRMDYGIFG